ncbi:hypothetical protein B4Q04_21330 [Zobellia sp. OII3]|nr:hypothetical protein B4Q04_21330 [Zobellia sp. OII3]
MIVNHLYLFLALAYVWVWLLLKSWHNKFERTLKKQIHMKYGSLVFVKNDFKEVKKCLERNKYIEDYSHKDVLEVFQGNLATALVVEADDMPQDVVRLNSMVTVSSIFGWEKAFQVVRPKDACIENERFSLCSKIGASVLGLSEDDVFKYGSPADSISLKIVKVDHYHDELKGAMEIENLPV